MKIRKCCSGLFGPFAAACMVISVVGCDRHGEDSPVDRRTATASAGQAAAPVDEDSLAYRIEHRFDHLPSEERQQAIAIQQACDNENLGQLRSAIAALSASTNAELRLFAVEALGWFDHRTVEDFEAWFSDADESVYDAAVDGWDSAISQIDSPKRRIMLSSKVILMDVKSALRESASAQFVSAANELIDGSDSERDGMMARRKVVATVIGMIENPNAEIAKAGRGIYEEITGGSWKSREDSEKYVENADKYMDAAAEEFAKRGNKDSK